jgi:HEAT repeat protein
LYDEDHWERFSKEKVLQHIELKQVHYAIKGKLDESSKQLEAAKYSESAEIRLEKFRHIPQILRGMLGAARASKLYPVNSKAFSNYVDKFMKVLRDFLARQPVLTLSQVGNALLVNGERIDCSDFKTLAEGFLKFLDHINLNSISFLPQVSARELQVFYGALGNLPGRGAQKVYWEQMAEEQKFSGILFDKHLYESWMTESGNGMRPAGDGEKSAPAEMLVTEGSVSSGAEEALLSDERLEALLQELPQRINDLLLRGKDGEVGDRIRQLFEGLEERPVGVRERVPDACRKTLEVLTVAHRYDFIRHLYGAILSYFPDEQDPEVILPMGGLLNALAGHFIELADYASAGQILVQLQRRYRSCKANGDPQAQTLATILSRKLEPTAEKVLLEDLKSGDAQKRRNASLLLAGLGDTATPLLVNVIKGEDNFRARRIAIMILGERGGEGAELVKRELAQEISAEERIRILDVIDSLTRDVKTELSQAISNRNPQVRQAGFRLAERLNDNHVVALLLHHTKDQRTEVAVSAITSLGKLRAQGVSQELAVLLRSSKVAEIQAACCRALGRIADPSSIEALVAVLAPKRFLLFRRDRDAQVREAAAVALSGMSRPRAVEALARFAGDRDHVVREIVQGVVGTSGLAS